MVKCGFKNVVYYFSVSWFNNNWMEYDVLGKENSWVVEWLVNLSVNNLLYIDIVVW